MLRPESVGALDRPAGAQTEALPGIVREVASPVLRCEAVGQLPLESPQARCGFEGGGMIALEMGRGGAPLKGIVSFHGALASANPKDARFFKAPALVLHGSADPFVPPAEVAGFEKEMKAAKKPYRIVKYPKALHAFTVKGVDKLGIKGAAYDSSADRKSWAEMSAFLKRKLE